jgi:hemoglobin
MTDTLLWDVIGGEATGQTNVRTDMYISQFGHPRLRARHMPYSIGIAERDQWLVCMGKAMQDIGLDPKLADRLLESFLGTADWMRNQAN